MLNMLIAIASDSYADAKEKGPKLFRILRLNYCVEVNLIERVLLKYKYLKYLFYACLIFACTFVIDKRVKELIQNYDADPQYDEDIYSIVFFAAALSILFFVATAYGVLIFHIEQPKTTNSTLQSSRTVRFNPFNAYFRFISRLLCMVGESMIGSITDGDDLHGPDHVCPLCLK
mmetsp:Transcript_5258/g.7793  ORF Transcript_5258/g.7793 Transcript_5258/m.7793 type:complete len:174 (+) Transcript_5258:1-522(+)